MEYFVQQIMLGSVTGDEKKASDTLNFIKNVGYDGIELNSFMITPTSFMVRALTKAAGMPTGKGGKLDWVKLISEANLKVPSIHFDLGTIERNPDMVIETAKKFGVEKIVITGMYRFDYTDGSELSKLCDRLNLANDKLKEADMSLLYHNHNIEFQKVDGKFAYDYIIENTDVDFELDSFWMSDCGVNPVSYMERLGDRFKLYHITDRGSRVEKTPMTPILKSDSMELGYGAMDLDLMMNRALPTVDAVILESHRNWVDNSPLKSLELSYEFLKKY